MGIKEQAIKTAGPSIETAAGALLLLHGRGAAAQSILDLYPELHAEHLAALAPQANNNTWYPYSFLSPLEANQPHVDNALTRIESLIDYLTAQNIPSERIAILGFSQGACLALEFAATHPRRYGAVMGLSGGLIGPEIKPERYLGALSGTPVLLGSSDPDPHVPWERVQETEAVLTRMGAMVDLRHYPKFPHAINGDEIQACRDLLKRME